MSKQTDKDTQGHSGDSGSKVSEASHDARDHATKSGDFERGNSAKNSERFSPDSKAGKEASGFFDKIMGKK